MTTFLALLSYADDRVICADANEIGLGYSAIHDDNNRKMTLYAHDCQVLAIIDNADGFCAKPDPGWPYGYKVECDQNQKVSSITIPATDPHAPYENCYDPLTDLGMSIPSYGALDSCDDDGSSKISYCCKKTVMKDAIMNEYYPLADNYDLEDIIDS